MGVINHLERAPMTRAERWAKEDEDRRLRQAVARHESPDSMTEAVVGYFAWKAGAAADEAFSSSSDVTDSKSED